MSFDERIHDFYSSERFERGIDALRQIDPTVVGAVRSLLFEVPCCFLGKAIK